MPHSIVIFGASGDLTSRKLIPALYAMFRKHRLPAETNVIGVSRTAMTSDAWRDKLRATTEQFAVGFDADVWNQFAACVHYCPGDIETPRDVASVSEFLSNVERGQDSTRVYYLSMSPNLYPQAVTGLGAVGMSDETNGPRRIVIEKPFGVDLKSAKRLNRIVHGVFAEHQVYRIDHYLGKESVQNLLILRFANSIFEPIWNRNYIDHVQITVAEEVAVGRRAAYYDSAGVLRDMFQNHLLQLLTITAMEAPVRFAADMVRDEKVKVLQAVERLTDSTVATDTLRGQYHGYLDEDGVPSTSQTATFAALKLFVGNWRWNGVPFYLRSGKAMSCRTTQIVIQFRQPPHMMFADGPRKPLDANRLVIQIQPAEGIQLQFLTKVPDAGMRMTMTDLNFSFRQTFSNTLPDAYQRLLLDALNGDASLFARSDEVEQAWQIIDPIIAAWSGPAAPQLDVYEPGIWGPDSSTSWMQNQGRQWFDVCPVLHG